MSIRKVSLVDEEYYHIYNRGNNKQNIFIDDEDRDRFVKLLYLCNSTKKINFKEDIVQARINAWDFKRDNCLVAIGAWVLMPNHFHLYLKALPKQGFGKSNNITNFMGKLCTAYVKYFNKKYRRTGSLFEGKFKSVHIKDEVQAKYLFSYIHLNPVKLIQSDWKETGIKNEKETLDFLDSYRWNSYSDYLLIKRSENKIINKEEFINYFSEISDFKKEIFDWLKLESTEARLR